METNDEISSKVSLPSKRRQQMHNSILPSPPSNVTPPMTHHHHPTTAFFLGQAACSMKWSTIVVPLFGDGTRPSISRVPWWVMQTLRGANE